MRVYYQGKSQQLPRAPPYFPRGKSILGVMYGDLLWTDMNAATPLGARGALPFPQTIPECIDARFKCDGWAGTVDTAALPFLYARFKCDGWAGTVDTAGLPFLSSK